MGGLEPPVTPNRRVDQKRYTDQPLFSHTCETCTDVLLLGAVPPHRQLRSDANVRNVIVIVCDNYVFHPVKVGCHLIALKITATDRSCVRPINCTPDIAAGLRSLLLPVAYGPLNTAVRRWWTWRVLPPRLRLASVDRITIIGRQYVLNASLRSASAASDSFTAVITGCQVCGLSFFPLIFKTPVYQIVTPQ